MGFISCGTPWHLFCFLAVGALLQKQQQTNKIQFHSALWFLGPPQTAAVYEPGCLPLIFMWLLAVLAGLSVTSHFLTSEARLKPSETAAAHGLTNVLG